MISAQKIMISAQKIIIQSDFELCETDPTDPTGVYREQQFGSNAMENTEKVSYFLMISDDLKVIKCCVIRA